MGKGVKSYKSKEGYEICIGIYTEYPNGITAYCLRLIKDGGGHGFGLLEKHTSFEDADLKRIWIAKNFELEEIVEN